MFKIWKPCITIASLIFKSSFPSSLIFRYRGRLTLRRNTISVNSLIHKVGSIQCIRWVLKYSNYWWGCGERRWRGVNPRKRVYSSHNPNNPPSLLAQTKQTKITLIVLGRERASAWKKHWRKQRMGNQVKVHLVTKVDHLVIISVVFITIVAIVNVIKTMISAGPPGSRADDLVPPWRRDRTNHGFQV